MEQIKSITKLLKVAELTSKILVILNINLILLFMFGFTLIPLLVLLNIASYNVQALILIALTHRLSHLAAEAKVEALVQQRLKTPCFQVILQVKKIAKDYSYILRFTDSMDQKKYYYNIYSFDLIKVMAIVQKDQIAILNWLEKETRTKDTNLYPLVDSQAWIRRFPGLFVKKANCKVCNKEVVANLPFINHHWVGLASQSCCQQRLEIQIPRTAEDEQWYQEIYSQFHEVLDS